MTNMLGMNGVFLSICGKEVVKLVREAKRRIDIGEYFYKGDIIAIKRWGGLYEHYGVYIGDGRVIHFSAKEGDFGGEITVHEASFDDFVRNDLFYYKVEFGKRDGRLYSPEETVVRAKEMIGNNKKYNLITNNCEHFARWCKTGKRTSTQVVVFKLMLAANILTPTARGGVII